MYEGESTTPGSPTAAPTQSPTASPTNAPTETPTSLPTAAPTAAPTGTISTAWEFSTDNAVWSSVAVADGVVYASSKLGTMYALRATDGLELWSFSAAGTAQT